MIHKIFISIKREVKFELVVSFLLTLLIPTLYLINLLLILYTSDTMKVEIIIRLIAAVAVYIGLGFWLISFIQLGRLFGVLPLKQKRVKRGLYKWFKHPMYIGIILTFLGLSLASCSKKGLLFTLFVMLPMLVIRSRLEEIKLEN